MKLQTVESQYKEILSHNEEFGISRLGRMTSCAWGQDPKRLLFTLARYKFVGKMFSGFPTVLEIGCGDAFATRIVQQTVGSVTATDIDPVFQADARKRTTKDWKMTLGIFDITKSPHWDTFDGIFMLDVLEHIPPEDQRKTFKNVQASLNDSGVFICGLPSLESQKYASSQSSQGHVNCQSVEDLKESLHESFSNVFIFSMNDEVLHTGFHEMSQYILAMCCGPLRLAPTGPVPTSVN